MKKLIAILIVVLVTGSVIAQDTPKKETKEYRIQFKETLIDFTKIDPENDPNLTIAFGKDLSLTLPESELATLQPVNYGLQHWIVEPQNSIRTPEVLDISRTIGVVVQSGEYKDATVLGIRLKFPEYLFNMHFNISPPFPPTFNSQIFLENTGGVLRNIGLVRSAYLTIYGLYQQEKIYIVTEDSNGEVYEYPFGALDFVGWRTLEWMNPTYLENAVERPIDDRPFYPRGSTSRRLKSIKIERSALYPDTDFVTYIHSISLTFDRAINEDLFPEFANEDTWGIIKEISSKRENLSIHRTATKRYFQHLESRKKYDIKKDVQSGSGQ